jgi:hypothetical protein
MVFEDRRRQTLAPAPPRNGHNPGRPFFHHTAKGVVMPIETIGPETVERAARHQTVLREVNEQIAKRTELASATGFSLFICECSDTNCAESLEITPAEYEAVRSKGACFLLVPGHQQEGNERVVDGNERFLVVEKVGEAAAIARDSDPRHV